MKGKIIDFLKRNKQYIIMLLMVLLFIGYSVRKERILIRTAGKLAAAEASIQAIQKDRDYFKLAYDSLREERKVITRERDSLIRLNKIQEKELALQKQKHQREIDSLLNIPDDSVFVRLQPIYPNPASNPLLYPFSGNQIRQIYSTALNYPRLQDEYSLQSGILKTCSDINEKYKLSEANLLSQIGFLNKNISACDQQLKLKDEEVRLTTRQLKNKKFWNWTYKGALILVGGYAVIK